MVMPSPRDEPMRSIQYESELVSRYEAYRNKVKRMRQSPEFYVRMRGTQGRADGTLYNTMWRRSGYLVTLDWDTDTAHCKPKW